MDRRDGVTGEMSWWDDDDRLLAELGAAVGEGEVPESFVRTGSAAFAWRTVDAELAELQHDSSLEAPAPAGLRGEPSGRREHPQPRALSFEASEISIEIEIHPDAVRGQLVPGQPGMVLVRDERGERVAGVSADDVGWFVIEPVPAGPFRLHVRPASGAAVITDWIVARA